MSLSLNRDIQVPCTSEPAIFLGTTWIYLNTWVGLEYTDPVVYIQPCTTKCTPSHGKRDFIEIINIFDS